MNHHVHYNMHSGVSQVDVVGFGMDCETLDCATVHQEWGASRCLEAPHSWRASLFMENSIKSQVLRHYTGRAIWLNKTVTRKASSGQRGRLNWFACVHSKIPKNRLNGFCVTLLAVSYQVVSNVTGGKVSSTDFPVTMLSVSHPITLRQFFGILLLLSVLWHC